MSDKEYYTAPPWAKGLPILEGQQPYKFSFTTRDDWWIVWIRWGTTMESCFALSKIAAANEYHGARNFLIQSIQGEKCEQ